MSNYENYKLCETLTPSTICIVVEQYNEGKFDRSYHEHIPKSRISVDRRINMLRALVVRFSLMNAGLIVYSYLNKRGKKPPVDNSLQIETSYPEAGVLRVYCGGNIKAWSDEVTSPKLFRSELC